MYNLKDKVKVSPENDNESYDSFRDEILIITHIAVNTEEHPGYDEAMEGMQLMDFETEAGDDVPCSLYEYEIESI